MPSLSACLVRNCRKYRYIVLHVCLHVCEMIFSRFLDNIVDIRNLCHLVILQVFLQFQHTYMICFFPSRTLDFSKIILLFLCLHVRASSKIYKVLVQSIVVGCAVSRCVLKKKGLYIEIRLHVNYAPNTQCNLICPHSNHFNITQITLGPHMPKLIIREP